MMSGSGTVPLAVALCLVSGISWAGPRVTPDGIRVRLDGLRPGTARQAGLTSDRVAAPRGTAESYLVPTPDHPTRPTYPGAAVLAAHPVHPPAGAGAQGRGVFVDRVLITDGHGPLHAGDDRVVADGWTHDTS